MCFITNEHGRKTFLGDRIPLRPAAVVDRDGERLGAVESVELVTIGQRKGLGLAGGTDPRYVIDVSAAPGGDPVVTVGEKHDLATDHTPLESWRWVGDPPAGDELWLQCSAPRPRRARSGGRRARGVVGSAPAHRGRPERRGVRRHWVRRRRRNRGPPAGLIRRSADLARAPFVRRPQGGSGRPATNARPAPRSRFGR